MYDSGSKKNQQNTIYNSLRHDTKNYTSNMLKKKITEEENYQLPAITARKCHDRRISITKTRPKDDTMVKVTCPKVFGVLSPEMRTDNY